MSPETPSRERPRRPAGPAPLRVVHFTDPSGAGNALYGKENVIVSLMHAQRASGRIAPELVTFTPGLLNEKMQAAGFPVHTLGERHAAFPARSIGALRRLLGAGAPAVVHSHEYKASIIARIARAGGARMVRHVATCHGWVDRSPQLDAYYALDRLSAVLSEAVTVTDPSMLELFPRLRPRRLTFIANGIPDRAAPTAAERVAARAYFGFPAGVTVIGSIGRLTVNKGIRDILAAARRTADLPIVWAIAGLGALSDEIAQADLPNVRYVGYQSDNVRYFAALDIYLQASAFEGLSLSLLEAMRAGLPSVSTRAGATELAIRERTEALLVDAGDIDAIVAAAWEMTANPELRERLGAAARRRFETTFLIEQQHAAFAELYAG